MRQTEYPVLEPEWQQFNQLALSVDAAHIWAASLEAQSELLLQSDIPEKEWAIGGRFRNSADQLRYWIGRKMLHQVLPAYVGINLRPIKIAYYEFGKPFLEGREDLKFTDG